MGGDRPLASYGYAKQPKSTSNASQQNNTCCIPRQKISLFSLQTLKKAVMAYISASSFKEFLVEIYQESHSYRKLIMMSVPAIHILYNLEHFVRSSCEGYKKISDSFR